MRIRPFPLFALALGPALALACSGGVEGTVADVDGGADGGAGAIPCAVDTIVEKNCRQCHGSTPNFGAPMPLVTLDDFKAARGGTTTYQLSQTRIHDPGRRMPQPPNAPLSEADAKVFDDWVAQGAPAGNACTGGTDAGTGTDGSISANCTPDVELASPDTWTQPTDSADDYICYGVDVPVTEKRQAIAFVPRVDNKQIVHHILLFQAPKAVSSKPAPCAFGGERDWKIIYGWAPGGQAVELPPEAGYPMDATAHYVVQVHYNNARGLVGQTDRSGVSLCTTNKIRPNDADVLAFGSVNFSVPPMSTKDITCNLQVPTGLPDIHLVAAFPHMHEYGTTISTTSNGVDLGTVANWNFNNQPWFPVDHVVKAGDTVTTRCAWKNPTNQPVTFGEKTGDEMCFSFTMYYPKITSPQWNWGIPAAISKCTNTPTP